jgi:hypothetical protein
MNPLADPRLVATILAMGGNTPQYTPQWERHNATEQYRNLLELPPPPWARDPTVRPGTRTEDPNGLGRDVRIM